MTEGAAVVIRRMEPGDVPAAVSVFAAVVAEKEWLGTEPGFDPEQRMAMLRESLADPRNRRLLVAVEPDLETIVGMAYAQREPYGVADIGMSVAQEWRGQGLGGRLLDVLIDECRELGAHKVALQVWPHNIRAIRLYHSRGFAEEGRLVRHYRRQNGELWDALVMGLVLDRTSPGSPHRDEPAL